MNDLNEIVKNLKEATLSTLGHTSQAIKNHIDKLLQKPSISVEELAAFISTHPETKFESKEFLRFQYNFYELIISNHHFYLETKGEYGEHILQLTITSPSKPVFEYRSFEHRYSKDTKLNIPETINNLIH